MILLDTNTRKLQIVLAEAVTANQCPWLVSYVDITATTAGLGASNCGNTNSATAVDMVAAPSASTTRKVLEFSVRNSDTAVVSASILYNDNGTTYIICKATLAVGDNMIYNEINGLRIVDASGNFKTIGSGSSGTGDVIGPSSSIDGNAVVFNGTTGKVIKSYQTSLGRILDNGVCDGRLTLSSTDDAPTSDITAATTLYFLPAKSLQKGNRTTLYDTTEANWFGYLIPSAGVSIAIPSTTDTNYDVFLYNSATGSTRFDSPTLALELVAWTNATTRATALATQDGVLCKTGALDRRYVGAIRTGATSGQIDNVFSSSTRSPILGVWNAQNRIPVSLRWIPTAATQIYYLTDTTERYLAGDSNAHCDMVSGLPTRIKAVAMQNVTTVGSTYYYHNIGLGSLTSQSNVVASCSGSNITDRTQQSTPELIVTPSAGFNSIFWTERNEASGTTTLTPAGGGFSGLTVHTEY